MHASSQGFLNFGKALPPRAGTFLGGKKISLELNLDPGLCGGVLSKVSCSENYEAMTG